MVLGLPKSTAMATCTPQGRMAAAMRAISGMSSGVSSFGLALTLLMEQAWMPTDARRRAYSAARVRSARAWPASQKIDRPP